MYRLFSRLTRRQVRRPSRALVVASLAVFISLTGTAYAANTVGSSDIIDESIQSVDLKNGEVKSADVADHSLTGVDINAATVPGIARNFKYVANASSDATLRTVFLTFEGFAFKGTCLLNGSATYLILREAGPSSWLDYELIESANSAAHPDSESGSQTLRGDRDRLETGLDHPLLAIGGPAPNSGAPQIVFATGSTYRRAQGTAFLVTDAGLSVRIDIDATADNSTHSCLVEGTATRAV